MLKLRVKVFRMFFVAVTIIVTLGFSSPFTSAVRADGYIDFENGVDAQPIQSTIPGLQFTTTQGYDWIYGDWRTGNYNGPYPSGPYYSNGNFFAWLGPNQGAGRIDFTSQDATYLQVYVSSNAGLIGEAYNSSDQLIASSSVSANLNTGQMARLRLDAPPGENFAYVILHDSGNFWLIDDLSTDASNVPTSRLPVVLIPGVMGSFLNVYKTDEFTEDEIWPPAYDSNEHAINLEDLITYDFGSLLLAEDGFNPANPNSFVFSTNIIDYFDIKLAGQLVREMNYYDKLILHLEQAGFPVYQFHYDWRLDVRNPLSGQGADQPRRSLEQFIEWVLEDSQSEKVNIVAHSMGGIVTRSYISSSAENADKVEQAVILGTPYLGAPKTMLALRAMSMFPGFEIPLISDYLRGLAENIPPIYQLIPSARYNNVNGGDWFRRNNVTFDSAETIQFIRDHHNSNLMTTGEELHDIIDYWDPLPGNVPFRFIVGSGLEDTPGLIIESETPWWDVRGTRWDVIPTNGDGTVPVVSASLEGNAYNYRGDVPIWYADNVKHGDLVRENYILDFIVAILSTPPNVGMQYNFPSDNSVDYDAPGIFVGDPAIFVKNGVSTTPPTPPEMSQTPFAVNGAQITAYYTKALHIYDEFGNHTGPTLNGMVETQIPGSSYINIGNGIFVTIPAGSVYTAEIEPDGDQMFDLRVRDIEGIQTQLIQRTITYASVKLDEESMAILNYDPDDLVTIPPLGIDHDSDGSIDDYLNPSGVVGSEESYDFDPPSSSIQLTGTLDEKGWYTGSVLVTMSASDTGSGVAFIEYTLDGGRTINKYNDPFYVIAEQVPEINAQAVDLAGNHETEGSMVRLRPWSIFIPLISAK